VVVEVGSQCISCKFSNQNQEFSWFLTAVYAKCKKIERRELWSELGAMRSLCEGPWVVGGISMLLATRQKDSIALGLMVL